MQEMDSVEAIYGLGKTNAIIVARRGYKLDLLGQPMADINKVVKEATIFIAAYYSLKTSCSSMADFRQQQWAYILLEHQQQPESSAVCHLQLHVSFEQYFRRAHHQVALSVCGIVLSLSEDGWE